MRPLLIAGILLAAVGVVFAAAPADDEHQRSPVGTVIAIQLGDKGESQNREEHLHFCVFENGEHDYIYVGTKRGMWSSGEFDLSIHGRRVFTGRVPHLLYGGSIIQMGDVLDKQPSRNATDGVFITRITGTFK